jgi:hypothetical protein
MAGASLFVPAEKRDHRVSEIFPSLQIFRHPGVSLRKCSVHVRDIDLARPSQVSILLRLFPIALRSFRSVFHFLNTPLFTPV